MPALAAGSGPVAACTAVAATRCVQLSLVTVNHALGADVDAQVTGNTVGANIGGVASNLVDGNWGNLWGTSEFVNGQTLMTVTLDLRRSVSICQVR